jgi:hypothetical protein
LIRYGGNIFLNHRRCQEKETQNSGQEKETRKVSHQELTNVGYFLRRKSISLYVSLALSLFKARYAACAPMVEASNNIRRVNSGG